ncbi:glutaredoxin [Pseudomonas sp. BN415]|uniref:glutathione S-transferase N-terminal domain-containing protein n=1 Tax=Pseudomonas sp. BN415 TaxID=2567889 RepID=UPI002458ACEF|nr:glutathione S-transferase N-terminal domain-containing protein [Pseudomonas sp. BN415]MDH4584910.1 glutaredoxin [Pseudomonas sp. BN415]
MFIKALRVGLSQLIIFLDFITRPRKLRRNPEAQAQVAEETANLALYQFNACPFCVKTRRAMHRLNLPIALRDAKNDETHRATLLAGGGKIKVPCLRIDENGESRWMYESNDIIRYLESRFDKA